jgi:hypothetical protein
MIKILCKQSFYALTMNVVVAVAGFIPSSLPLGSRPGRRPSTSRPVIIVFHVVISRCPAAAIVGTRLQQSSADSHEQRCRGEEDPIHTPALYFLLIVVFVAVKEIIVVDMALPSHSSAPSLAIAATSAVAIIAVAP